jgi:hypothetical protein
MKAGDGLQLGSELGTAQCLDQSWGWLSVWNKAGCGSEFRSEEFNKYRRKDIPSARNIGGKKFRSVRNIGEKKFRLSVFVRDS